MTIVPMIVRCEKCHRKYSFNPDVGKNLICPHCLGTGNVINKVSYFLKRRKKDVNKN